jgi:hypothetical protein
MPELRNTDRRPIDVRIASRLQRLAGDGARSPFLAFPPHSPFCVDVDVFEPLAVCRKFGPNLLSRLIRAARALPSTIAGQRLAFPDSDWHVAELGLPRASYRALTAAGVYRCATLSAMTLEQVVQVPGLGVRGILQILTAISRHPCLCRDTLEWPDHDESIAATLRKLETIPGALDLTSDDPRLGRHVGALERTGVSFQVAVLRAMNVSFIGLNDIQTLALNDLCTAIAQVNAAGIRDEVFAICFPEIRPSAKAKTSRNVALILHLLGFRTGRRETLETTGRAFGITRERVRQLCKSSFLASNPAPPFAPVLDSVLIYIRSRAPVSVAILHDELQSAGVRLQGATVETILHLGKLLGRNTGVALMGEGDDAVVHVHETAMLTSRIERAVKRVARVGAAKLTQLLAAVNRDKWSSQSQLTEEAVIEELQFIKGVSWLDREAGWFSYRASDERPRPLWIRIRKVLAVAGTICARDLRTALRKDARTKIAPPEQVLVEFCRRQKACCVVGDTIAMRAPQSPLGVLKGPERTLVDLLLEHGGVCHQETLQKLAVQRGVSPPSFWRCLTYAPTIMRYARGVYGLVGANVHPGMIDSLMKPTRRPRLVLDHGWTSNGGVWLAYRTSSACLATGVIGVPSAKRGFIKGSFNLTDHNGVRMGKVAIRASSMWGLGSYFRKTRAQRGDTLILVFDVPNRIAIAQLGNASLLDDFRRSL